MARKDESIPQGRVVRTAKVGTVIAKDGGREIRTPYDNCVLVMPTRRITKGQTAVRLGRYG